MEKIYLSNRGRGPGIAQIVSVVNGRVTIRHKANRRSKLWSEASMSSGFFFGPRCGWKPAPAGGESE